MTLVRFNQRNCAPARNWNPVYHAPFNRDWNNIGWNVRNTAFPAANIVETEDNFTIELSVPGFRKTDFKIKIEDNIMTISGEFKADQANENSRYTRYEFARDSFNRRFRLSKWVDASGIQASYEDGILLVTIPKKEEAKSRPAREIEIS
jgi:HSP20 family protein